MNRTFLVPPVTGLAMLLAAPADAQQAVSFESCAALRAHIDTRQPNEHVLLAPAVYECREPINPSVDGLTVDFGGSLVRVADQAVRPGIVLGDLHTPPQRRSKGVRVLNVKVDGNRAHQAYECWGGPCDAALNDNPYRQQRVNGITVNGCDDCALINAEVTGARSGFSFDLDFSGNRIERFEATGNRDHGLFVRHARANTFVHGTFSDNGRNGVYLDRADRARADTCARETRFEDVTVRGSGMHAAWLNFECDGNAFVASYLIENQQGCYGGPYADLIGRVEGTACTGAAPQTVVEAEPGGNES